MSYGAKQHFTVLIYNLKTAWPPKSTTTTTFDFFEKNTIRCISDFSNRC